MRFLGPALLLPLFLAGCAIPPAATAVSLVLEGVSFVVTTGKSTADHAIFRSRSRRLHAFARG
jgi:hypothetical protein